MESGLLAQGIELMLVGMGTVFVFLTLLVGATSVMSSFATRWQPPADTDAATDEEVAAISAAIARHRQQ